MSVRPKGVFGHAAVFAVVLLAAAPQADQLDTRLAKLYDQQRLLQVRELLESQTANSADLLFYRGLVANAFNQPAASIDLLTAFLDGAGDQVPDAVLGEVLGVLDEDHAMLFEYAKSAEVRERELPLIQKDMTPLQVDGFLSITGLWKALSAAPPQTVEIPGTTELALSAAGEVTAVINGVEIPFLPDTGSELSMIARADAERLGLETLDVAVAVGTATGKEIKAPACVVPELRLAGIRVRNAVFLIVPDERLYFSDMRRQLHGLLGFPVLSALTELTFTGRGKLTVNAPPRLEGPPNFFLARTDPVLEAEFRDRTLQFFLDTGSFQTQLFPRFFKAFEADILRSGSFLPATIEGIGTRTRAPVYLMSGLMFRVGDEDVRFLKALPILTRAVGEPSGVFDGAFGLDVLENLRELTINYGAMRILLR